MTATAEVSRQIVVRVRDEDRAALAEIVARHGFHAVDKPDPGLAPRGLVVDPSVLGTDGLGRIQRAALAYPRAPLMVLTGPLERAQLAELLDTTTVAALIARDTRDRANELDLALRTVTAPVNGPPPGIDTLVNGTPTGRYTCEIASSEERDSLIERLEGFLVEGGIRQRMVRLACDAIEELVTNALYDAPTDADGKRIHAEVDRRVAVHLAEHQRPRLELGVYPPLVVASMIDPHGSLDLATVRRFLASGLRGDVSNKAGGAGLGFGRVYALVDRLVVRIVTQVRTETAFVIDTSGPRKDPAARPTGFLGWQV